MIPSVLVFLLANSSTCADERADPVEQLALTADSANGLFAARQPQKFLGARSCAASACHGGIDPDPRFPLSRRHEYVHWLDKDPHSRGYQTLQNGLSKAILGRLARPTDDDATRAKRLANCFGCHNPQPDRSKQETTFYVRDAVSCEICHGPAQQWIGPHVTQSWAGIKQAGDASALGFINTEDITIRAQTCAACHVGSPGREVNHDLIAAGHPVLKFELTAYHAMLPKHWRDREERKSNPKLEIELWRAGQIACGAAAIDLLKWRAERAANEPAEAVWPEFAEYDCFACHHDLVHPSWRQQISTSKGVLGMPAWGSWYFSRLKDSAGESLQPLAVQMQRGFRPDPKLVAEIASAVRLVTPELDAAIGLPANWDDATQQYLALVAAEQTQRDAGKPSDDEVTSRIATLREQLAFPRGQDSPRWRFEPGDASVTRDQVHRSLLDLMQQLQRRKEN
ncbi:MAG: multiheme c-type cytochrome [Planctomycetota bacterium]|nr:multiheme c-type cytochrome [Planctomycetota bacterium]